MVKCGADIHYINTKGHSLLYYAIISENTKMIEFLIDLGLDPNFVSRDGSGDTPLHYISYERIYDKEVFKTLIRRGADIEKINKDGYTPLYIAVISENEKAVTALIENGADVNRKCDVLTPLLIAKKLGKNEEIKKLLAEKSNLKTRIESKNLIFAGISWVLDPLLTLPKSVYKATSDIAVTTFKSISNKANIKAHRIKKEVKPSLQSPNPEISANSNNNNAKTAVSANTNDDYVITAIFASHLFQYYIRSRNNSRITKMLDKPANLTKDQISKLSSQILKAPGLRIIYSTIIMLLVLQNIDSSVYHWNKTHEKDKPFPSKYTYAKNTICISTAGFLVGATISYIVSAWNITSQPTDYKILQFIKQCCIKPAYIYDRLLSVTFVPESICVLALAGIAGLIGNAVDSRAQFSNSIKTV